MAGGENTNTLIKKVMNEVKSIGQAQWGKVYAVLTGSKNMHAGILKKSKAPRPEVYKGLP